jgi:hypothetical protein
MQPLYNREGRAVAYIADNNVSIYLYDGSAAGWIYQGSLVFAYSGKFLGWLMYGWLCDPRGNPAFFTDRSIGGPKRAVRQPRPVRASRGARPARRQRHIQPSRPGLTTRWSEISDESFFDAGPIDPTAPLESDASESESESPSAENAAPPTEDAPPLAENAPTPTKE